MAANLDFVESPRTPAATSFFFRLVEDLGKSLEPTETQLQTLERSYTSTGEYLSACDEFAGELVDIHPHGSRQIGTITRPFRKRDGFDIDLIARFDKKASVTYSGINGATLLLNRLHVAVSRYAQQHGLKLHRWERCVTLEYADGMCADIAPVIDSPHYGALHGELHGQIPDRELQSFHPTNPRGFTKYFNKLAEISPNFIGTEVFKAEAYDGVRRFNSSKKTVFTCHVIPQIGISYLSKATGLAAESQHNSCQISPNCAMSCTFPPQWAPSRKVPS